TVKPLYTPPRLGTNLFSVISQNDNVLFIEQYAEKRSLKSLDLKTIQVRTLNENVATSHLQKTKLGIILTSSQSGVDNLYLTTELNDSFDLAKSQVLTNSQTRILDGDIDPVSETLYFSEQRSDGIFI